jgi:hypothetical protein
MTENRSNDGALRQAWVGTRNGFIDLIRDPVQLAAYIICDSWDADRRMNADQQVSQRLTELTDQWKESGQNANDFRMAAGWTVDSRNQSIVFINGQNIDIRTEAGQRRLESLGFRSTDEGFGRSEWVNGNVLSVFYRHQNGRVEILTERDPRFSALAMPYIATQVIGPAAWLGAARLVSGSGRAASATMTGIAAMDAVQAGSIVPQVIASPTARDFALNDLINLFTDPEDLNNRSRSASLIRNILNALTNQYSNPREQEYVQTVRDNQNPIPRLGEVLSGNLVSLRRDTPFSEPERSVMNMPSFEIGSYGYNRIMSGAFDTINKIYRTYDASWSQLTDGELMQLSIAMHVAGRGDGIALGYPQNATQRQQMVDALKNEVNDFVLDSIGRENLSRDRATAGRQLVEFTASAESQYDREADRQFLEQSEARSQAQIAVSVK